MREARIDKQGKVVMVEEKTIMARLQVDEFQPVQTIKVKNSEWKELRGRDISYDKRHNKFITRDKQ